MAHVMEILTVSATQPAEIVNGSATAEVTERRSSQAVAVLANVNRRHAFVSRMIESVTLKSASIATLKSTMLVSY